MRVLLLAAVLAVSYALPTPSKVRYDNYQVYRIVPKTEAELKFLRDVEKKFETVDFWQHPTKIGKAVDVMVSPAMKMSVLNALSRPGLTIDIAIPDVQRMIDDEATEIARRKGIFDPANIRFDQYHEYDEIDAWMTEFASANSGVTKVAVTTTYEGETVYGIRIEKSTSATNVAYIQGGIHAREWISPATMINLINYYIDNYGTDDTVTAMLDNFIWIIVPVYNIDGYKYTWTSDRMWRKNRNPNGGGCAGVDLNRNYDYKWGDAGKSKCSEAYQGPSELSEPETSGSKAFLKTFGQNLKLFIDFHSYGQYWLYPWGYTGEIVPQPDREAQRALAIAVEDSITAVGKDYFVGESGPDMYPATGASEDFGYGTLGVKYSYIVELRDQGLYGFTLPEWQIMPTAAEIFAGMKTLGQQLVAEYA